MNKAKEPWYRNNINAAVALTLIVAMIALCERIKIKDKGVKNETDNR